MKTQLAYCSACDQQVRIMVTPAPLHEGHANLPDPEVVCLDFGEKCTGALCPMFGLPSIVMGVRLARSGLRAEPWTTVSAMCQGCGQLSDLQIIDRETAHCTVCGTTNRLIRLKGDADDYVITTEMPG
jgi:hypothetical protein